MHRKLMQNQFYVITTVINYIIKSLVEVKNREVYLGKMKKEIINSTSLIDTLQLNYVMFFSNKIIIILKQYLQYL